MKEMVTRRNFLKKSSIAAAGLSISGTSFTAKGAPVIDTGLKS